MQRRIRCLIRCVVWEWERSILVGLMVALVVMCGWGGILIGSGKKTADERSRAARFKTARPALKNAWDVMRVSNVVCPPRPHPRHPGYDFAPTCQTSDGNHPTKSIPRAGDETHDKKKLDASRSGIARLRYNGFVTHGDSTSAVVTLTANGKRSCIPVTEGDCIEGVVEIAGVGEEELFARVMGNCMVTIPRGKELLLQ